MKHKLATILMSFALGAAACGGGGSSKASGPGGKADTPGSSATDECREQAGGDDEKFQECRDAAAAAHCQLRAGDALRSAQRAFTRDAIRWACSDVEGVNTNGDDDRGQEYCEYFAVVQLPPEIEGGELPEPTELGRIGGNGVTQLELTDDQLFAIEDQFDEDAGAVVGQCVFTSWHQDIDQELPVCAGGECPTLTTGDATTPAWMESSDLGLPLTPQFMKMKVSINSNAAAADLFEQCMTNPPAGDPDDPGDPMHDHYFRGCWKSYQLFQTEWRRSDPSVCAAGVRLAECGCGVDTDGDGNADITDLAEIARAVVPPQPAADGTVGLRGFPLGTWSGKRELPGGCRYVDTGDGSQTLVACDLTAGDVMTNPDLKQQCRDKYGDNVVVHVPVPAEAIVCTIPEGDPYTETCGAMPWVIGEEGQAPLTCETEELAGTPECQPEPGECCRVCVNSQACGNTCISKDLTCHQEPGCACDADPR